jgi:hypothetical protein
MTCLNPNNFRFNTSIETYNISFKKTEQCMSNAIIPASIAGFIVGYCKSKKVHRKLPIKAMP